MMQFLFSTKVHFKYKEMMSKGIHFYDTTYNYDHKFMLELIRKFPMNIYNKWISMCADLKSKNRSLNFGNLAFVLTKELPHIELKCDEKKIYENMVEENKKPYFKPKPKNDNNEEMWLNHASENYEETAENPAVY